jgi:hypothetical protein
MKYPVLGTQYPAFHSADWTWELVSGYWILGTGY